MNFDFLISEVNLKAVRSSGSGGQNVNKVSTKVELQFDLINSSALSEEQKELLQQNLKSRLTKDGVLILQCDESRSQLQNKKLILERFKALIEKGLEKKKERKLTKIPKAIKRKRLENKKRQSNRKTSRKKPDIDS